MDKIVQVEDVVKYYGRDESLVKAVDHVSFDIKRGCFTVIVGRSGSGKSTLLHLLGGLDIPDAGKIYIESRDIYALNKEKRARFRRENIGFVFQDYNLVPSLTVWENVILPLGLASKTINRNDVEDILKRIELWDKRDAKPNTLSGGQKQRCAIARALVTSPAIILADEPTGNLDSRTELEVMNLLKQCVREFGQTLVMITHDETIAQMADYWMVIEDGKVVSEQCR